MRKKWTISHLRQIKQGFLKLMGYRAKKTGCSTGEAACFLSLTSLSFVCNVFLVLKSG